MESYEGRSCASTCFSFFFFCSCARARWWGAISYGEIPWKGNQRPPTHVFWHQWLAPLDDTNLPGGGLLKCIRCQWQSRPTPLPPQKAVPSYGVRPFAKFDDYELQRLSSRPVKFIFGGAFQRVPSASPPLPPKRKSTYPNSPHRFFFFTRHQKPRTDGGTEKANLSSSEKYPD